MAEFLHQPPLVLVFQSTLDDFDPWLFRGRILFKVET